jgi:hypothetical protein
MSYDAHITRAPDWSISDELPIAIEEWEAVASSADLIKTSLPGYFYARAVRQEGEDASFEWNDGQITVQAADEPTLRLMIRLAERLNARVQGDDGERYTIKPDGSVEAGEAEGGI